MRLDAFFQRKKKRVKRFTSIFLVISMVITLVTAFPQKIFAFGSDDQNGTWSQKNVTLTNTTEAQLMVRVGDIDNFGKGWDIDPFLGGDTRVHDFPFYPEGTDSDGTDRIMVVSGYDYNGPNMPDRNVLTGYDRYGRPVYKIENGENKWIDGYTNRTKTNYDNQVRPITLSYKNQLNGVSIKNAVLQIFVDDFQAGKYNPLSGYKVQYTATINDVEIPELSRMINTLDQSGPRGRLITFRIPDRCIPLLETGALKLKIDDSRHGITGDGYAIDFVKLLVNFKQFSNTATIKGKVTDNLGNVISGAKVTDGGVVTAITASDGSYILDNVPLGQAIVTASKGGYKSQTKTIEKVISGNGYSLDFNLEPAPKPGIPTFTQNPTSLTSGNVSVAISYPRNPIIKEYSYDKVTWKAYDSALTIENNCTIYARGTDEYGNESDIGIWNVTNIDKTQPSEPNITLNPEGWSRNNVEVTISGSAPSSIIKKYEYKIDNGTWIDYNPSGKPIITTLGESKIYARAVSTSGVQGVESSKVAQIDKTPPTATITGNPTDWTKEAILTVAGTDRESGVKRIENPDGTWVNGNTATYTVSENKTYTFVVEDNAGNQQSVSCDVSKISGAAPKATISVYDDTGYRDKYEATNPLQVPAQIDKTLNPSIILKGNAVAQIEVKDDTKLQNVKYKFVQTPRVPADGELIEIKDSINQEIVYPDLIKDKVGYLKSRNYDVSSLPVKSNETVWNDRSQVFAKPSSIIEDRPANIASSVSDYITKQNGSFKNYTIFMNYLDLGNKGPYPDYKEAAKFWGYITPKETGDYYFGTISDDGSQGYIIVDGQKVQIVNQFKIQGSTFKTDNNKMHLEKGKYYPIYLEYSNWGGDGEFRLLYRNTPFKSISDSTGGINVPADWFRPTSNTEPGETSTATFESTAIKGVPFPEQTGTYYIAYKAENEAGGVRQGVYGPFLVDKTPPTATITSDPSTWTTKDVTLKLTASDEGSGVKRVQKPDGTWVDGTTTTYTVSDNGTYTFKVEDNAGNVATVQKIVDNIDNKPTAPTISLSTENWTNQNLTVTISGSTASSGILKYQYKLGENEAWIDYDEKNKPVVSSEGITVYARAISNAKIEGDIASKTVKIDKIPPTIVLNADKAQQDGQSIITANITDNASGIAIQKYAAGDQQSSYFATGGTTLTGTTFTVLQDQIYTVYAKDNAGNETVKTIDTRSSIVVKKGIFVNGKLMEVPINVVRSLDVNVGIGIKTLFNGQDITLQINKGKNDIGIAGNAFDLYEVIDESENNFTVQKIKSGIEAKVKDSTNEQDFTIPTSTIKSGYKYYLFVFKLKATRNAEIGEVKGNTIKVNSKPLNDSKNENPFEFQFNVKELPPLQ